MKLRTNTGLAGRVRAAIDGWVRSFSLRDKDLYVDRAMESETGVDVTPKAVMQVDAVWSCVRLISETIATLPLSMYERTSSGKRLASQHPLHFVIHDQPNADSTASVFWEAIVASMLLRGNGRAEKLYVGDKLVGLAFLDPNKLVITRDANGRKIFQYPRPDGTPRLISAARIWTLPGFTLDGETGVSVISYGAKVFGAAMAAERAAARTFRNGLLQTVYYKVAAFLKPEQRRMFKAEIAGSVERGETPVLEGGTDVGAIGIKPSDAQLLESRAFSVESICRWFRVPPWMVGHTEKSTSWGTGIEQQMIGFLTFTLGPWLRRIEQAISKDLLTPAERARFYPKFAVEGLLRADSAGRAAFYAAMVNNGILTRDEVRELEDREPMGGNAAVLTVQSAMTTLDGLGQAGGADQANQARAAIRAFLGFDEEPKKG
ncbi:phage portal protein [Paracidovorax citrulli]|uniref:phage portal protein n=1 Tax=Paracidovorax citrulli TaxID=80869 RepID=UPI0005FB00F5|nr:phage portal protein [Paracidovorax citrulli]UMT88369.1 phage portal protein [Paracidovorax citrulli]WIY32722.1 phage portal protein [Paracidovorax citrulli]SDJ31288.1 phage portal protein, HK97 family [Paracidovorax citrulli]